MLAGLGKRQDLFLGQGPRQPPGLPDPQRSGRRRPAGSDVVEERSVATPVDPPPGHQRLCQHHAVAGPVLVEGEQRGQVPVHRGRAAPAGTALQHRNVIGRGSQPRHEPRDVVHCRLVDGHAKPIKELQPQLQGRRVGPQRGRRSVQCLQMRQERLHRTDRFAGRAEHRPRLRPIRHQHPLHPHPDLHAEEQLPAG